MMLKLKKIISKGNNSFQYFGCKVYCEPDLNIYGMRNGSPTMPIGKGKVYLNNEPIKPQDGYFGDRFGVDIKVSNEYLLIGGYGNNPDKLRGGYVAAFKKDSNLWKETQIIRPSRDKVNNKFGYNLTINGETLAVGAYGAYCTDNGAVYLYKLEEGVWTEYQELTYAESDSSCFGRSVFFSPDGQYLFVSAHKHNLDKGTVICFDKNSNWGVKYSLKNKRKNINNFGSSLATTQSHLIVGAYGIDNDRGAVLIYNFKLDEPALIQIIEITDRNIKGLGGSLSITPDGKWLLIGAYRSGKYEEGSAHLYQKKRDGKYHLYQNLFPPSSKSKEWFGYSVYLCRESRKCLIGAAHSAKGLGCVYQYDWLP